MGKLSGMIGQKLFKKNDDNESISMIRITDVTMNEKTVSFYDYSDNENKMIEVEKLKDFIPLIPDGVCTFNIVKVITGKAEDDYIYDVLVTGMRYLSMQIKDPTPFCVCRQCCNDIFDSFSLNTHYVGTSVSQSTCPKGVDFMEFLHCDEIIYTKFINFYRNDTLDDILDILNNEPYDDILKANYNIHAAKEGDPKLTLMNYHKGWCTSLKRLLQDNNFQADLDEMLDIMSIDNNLSDIMVEKVLPNSEETYDSVNDEFKAWLSKTLDIMFGDITVIKYDHDLDMSDFNNTRYLFIRDNTKTLYLLVYTLDNEHHLADLVETDNAKNKFKLFIYNKYNK